MKLGAPEVIKLDQCPDLRRHSRFENDRPPTLRLWPRFQGKLGFSGALVQFFSVAVLCP